MQSSDLNLGYIKSKIQCILDKTHKSNPKKVIKSFPNDTQPDRLNFACPICGDSAKSDHKKRGNLYVDNLRFKCFNCDISMTFTKFCDTFNEPIDIDNRIKLYKYIDEHTTYKKTDEYILEELNKLIDIEEFMEHFNNYKNSWLYDIKPVQKNSHVYQYLKYERLIQNFSQIYQGIYRVIKDNKVVYYTPVMINMNMTLGDKKKILGIQLRNLEKDRNKRFYKIVEFEELYNYIHPNEPIDEMEAISYNKLSHFYNILNIDFEQPITIFEGFLDSIFYPNSIGMVGAKNDQDLLKFLTESDADLKLKFFYDNDTTGILKATKMLKKGFPVFLWNKLFSKLIEKEKNKYDAQNKLKNIIDLNDLVKAAKNPNVYKSLKLDNFFSIDEFDLIYLDKIVFDKKTKTWLKKN
ncbi:MAG: hypothetical protein HPY57_15705 [Ignavibacteria bacterium]|nr:hypothetical protein [Ignavibacteria bacterium]